MNPAFLIFGLAFVHGIVGAPRDVTEDPVGHFEVLKSNLDTPYQLAIDRDNNILYFSSTVNKENYNNFQSGFINLNDKSYHVIPNVIDGFAHAYDPQTKTVYIGASNGIYGFDHRTEQATNLNITDKSIWQLFYKDNLYFTTFPEEKAYSYKDGVVGLVPELKDRKAMLMAQDKNGDIVFSQDGGLMKIVKGRIENIGDYPVNAFSSDVEGDLYFSTSNTIYKFVGGEIQTVTCLDDIYGFAIEGDGSIIVSSQDSVLRLKTKPACPIVESSTSVPVV